MDVGSLLYALINTAGVGGLFVMIVYGGALLMNIRHQLSVHLPKALVLRILRPVHDHQGFFLSPKLY